MTLIEILVALALFALISILGARALTALQSQGQQLDSRQSNMASLSQVVLFMETDLTSARVMSGQLGQAIQMRVTPDKTEIDIAVPPGRAGDIQRWVYWIIDGQSVRRYPDKMNTQTFLEWNGVVSAVQLTGIQDDRRLDWQGLQPRQLVQAVEFRFRLSDGSEVIRLMALARRR
jgi:type II secretory pathway component PulJ